MGVTQEWDREGYVRWGKRRKVRGRRELGSKEGWKKVGGGPGSGMGLKKGGWDLGRGVGEKDRGKISGQGKADLR